MLYICVQNDRLWEVVQFDTELGIVEAADATTVDAAAADAVDPESADDILTSRHGNGEGAPEVDCAFVTELVDAFLLAAIESPCD